MAERIAVGIIQKPVGIKGNCAVTAIGNTLFSLEIPADIFIGKNSRDIVTVCIDNMRHGPKGCQCHFLGIDERDAAEKLRGFSLFIDQEALPELEADEYYHFELEGLEVRKKGSEKKIGTVREVINFPTMDAVEIVLQNGETILVPLSKEVVSDIDRENGRLYVESSVTDEIL